MLLCSFFPYLVSLLLCLSFNTLTPWLYFFRFYANTISLHPKLSNKLWVILWLTPMVWPPKVDKTESKSKYTSFIPSLLNSMNLFVTIVSISSFSFSAFFNFSLFYFTTILLFRIFSANLWILWPMIVSLHSFSRGKPFVCSAIDHQQ